MILRFEQERGNEGKRIRGEGTLALNLEMTNRTKVIGFLISCSLMIAVFLVFLSVRPTRIKRPLQPLVSVPSPQPKPTATVETEPQPEETVEAQEPVRAKRQQRAKAESEPTPAPYPTPAIQGRYARAYAGDVIGPMRFTVPTGAYVTLQADAGNLQAHHWTVASPMQCDERISIYPCQIDWVQPDGTIMRGHFMKCLKLDPNGTVDEFRQKFSYEDSCEWQRMNDVRVQ